MAVRAIAGSPFAPSPENVEDVAAGVEPLTTCFFFSSSCGVRRGVLISPAFASPSDDGNVTVAVAVAAAVAVAVGVGVAVAV